MNPQRLDLAYRIDWESNWHVGSGYASAAADRLILRFGGADGVPYVPGSLIKGVVRHHCERLVLALGQCSVDPHASSPEQRQKLVEHFHPLAHSSLMVDRLFGTRCQGECLFVDNAVPLTNPLAHGRERRAGNLRTRTTMDRVTGTVLEGHLFTTESVEPTEGPLEGRIRARHPAEVLTQDGDGFPFEYALLLAALLSVDSLGGNKSAGLGRCHINIADNSLQWNGQPLEISGALASFRDLVAEWAEWVQTVRAEREQL